MKMLRLILLAEFILILPAFADLTIVENVEGTGATHESTIKIKGDKMLFDMSPQMSTIYDSKTGEILQLMKDQKMIMRISAEKLKAASDLMNQNRSPEAQSTDKAKLTPTGKKETINGYEAVEYSSETSNFKVHYWLAAKLPGGDVALKQLQAMKPVFGDRTNFGLPDLRDLPAFPIRSVVDVGGTQITTTVVSIKQDSLNAADFAPPNDYKEIQMPDLGARLQQNAKKNGAASPKP